MTKLKPCPFCGRTPIIENCGDHNYFIKCKCGIAQDKLYFQKCDAVRRWNKRSKIINPDENWIPCKERQPQDIGMYLVTYLDKRTGEKYVTADDYFDYGWDDVGYSAIAWAELPEPYEAEE